MSELKKQERAALGALAKRLSATGEESGKTAAAYVVAAGKRVAVEIATLNAARTRQAKAGKPRLRFDKVVIELTRRLQTTLHEIVPDGMTVLLTLTAPIRLSGKTAGALEGKIQAKLERETAGRDERCTIHGNRARIRLVRHELKGAPKFIGFVHNPDTDPVMLLDMTCEWLELLGAEVSRRARRLAGDRWRMVVTARGSACLQAYRYISSQLPMAGEFQKVVMAFADGCVETLAQWWPVKGHGCGGLPRVPQITQNFDNRSANFSDEMRP
jgi:hypothetical protein